MSGKSVVSILFFVVFLLVLASHCHAAVWSSTELIEKSKELNGKELSYKGELITAILNRGEYSWINLNDGANAIGIWCKSSLLKDVKNIGDYKNKGDLLEVKGVFNRACAMHAGELDIHADALKIVSRGYPIREHINIVRVHSSAILFAITLLAVAIFRKRL